MTTCRMGRRGKSRKWRSNQEALAIFPRWGQNWGVLTRSSRVGGHCVLVEVTLQAFQGGVTQEGRGKASD